MIDITVALKNILVDIQDIIYNINIGRLDVSHNRMLILRGKVVMLCTLCGTVIVYNKKTILELFANTISPNISMNEIEANGNRIVTLLTAKKLWIESILENKRVIKI